MRVSTVQPVLKVAALLALMGGFVATMPSAAEAQNRGALQATATVVNTAPGFDALRATHTAARQAIQNEPPTEDTVSTLTSITVDEPRQGVSGSIIVTVAFAKN